MQPQARDTCGEKKDFARIMVGAANSRIEIRVSSKIRALILGFNIWQLFRFENIDGTKKRVYSDVIYKKKKKGTLQFLE